MADAHEGALRIARLAASEQNDLFQAARQLAFTLAQLPAVRTLDVNACRPLLAELLTRTPGFANIAVVAPTGEVVCSAVPFAGAISFRDREYFQRAVATRDFAVSGYLIGRISGKANVTIAYPAVGPGGRVTAVVTVALDLRRLNHLTADAQLPRGSTLLVIDQNSVVLARHPQGDQWIGRQVGDTPLAKVVLSKRDSGTADSTGLDGVTRLYGFTRLSASSEMGQVYLAVGIPRSVALAEPNRMLIRNLVWLAIVAAVTLAGARLVADRLVLRRAAALTAATRRLAAGDLQVRAGRPDDDTELGELARSFDEMAEALERRTAERMRATEELVRSEKMAALGRLAAGVAHELRNPLTVIAGRMDVLKQQMVPGQLPTVESLAHHFRLLEEAAQRMRRIMEGLATYSKPAKPEPVFLDVRELLGATKEMLAYEGRKHGVSIAVEAPPVLPNVLADRSALMQVFVNLATNAVQAMAETVGGRLTMAAHAADGLGSEVVVKIADTGPGIPADALEKIWEPFYTTKAEGTGIGLSIVRSLIAQQPGAAISVESRLGSGTTFQVTLPTTREHG